jgi:hypothetical protein
MEHKAPDLYNEVNKMGTKHTIYRKNKLNGTQNTIYKIKQIKLGQKHNL